MPTVRASEHVPPGRGVHGRVAAAQLLGVAPLDAELERLELVLPDGADGDLADEGRAPGRERVEAAGAVHDIRVFVSERNERVGERARQLRQIDTEQGGARARRVRQGAE